MFKSTFGDKKAFTLIELLLVVVIISILASVILPRLTGKSKKARIAAAEADISAIETALQLYEQDNGVYPTTEQGLMALVKKPTSVPIPESWDGPYLKKSKGFKDPWGRPYEYRCPGDHNTQDFDLFSLGADGMDGTEDDISNWQEFEN